MKDYKEVKLPKGLVGFESETGYNNWWYPDKDAERALPMDVTAEHLHLWKNQGDMVVFAIPLCVFKPTALFEDKGRKQYITLWFYTEDIDGIVNSQTV